MWFPIGAKTWYLKVLILVTALLQPHDVMSHYECLTGCMMPWIYTTGCKSVLGWGGG